MIQPNFYITPANFDQLIGPGLWTISDLPPERAEQVRPFLNNADTFAVFASGTAGSSIESPSDYVGGIDWIRLESNPQPDEPPLNVYHFGIGAKDANGYPVYGPFKQGAIINHWPSSENDVEKYFSS